MSNEKAFTLIEVIVSLVLIGIMAAIAGMGLIKIAEGYVFAKQNAETVQKAQIAMARIVKELSNAGKALNANSAITTATATKIAYTRPVSVSNAIEIKSDSTNGGVNGGVVEITGTTPGILINNVDTASSSFSYYDGAGTLITDPAKIPTIRKISVTLKVSSSVFNDMVFVQGSY
jgi:prepilin-type N-terminal cleavage/methylation domain-containing protein